jgi:hypothetical protein
MRDRSGFLMREEFESYLQTRGTSFLAQYRLFLQRAATGNWTDNAYLGSPTDFESDAALAGDHDEDDYPLDVYLDSDSDEERPEYLGTNFVWLDADGIPRDQGLALSFRADGHKRDEDIDWIALAVGIEDGDEVETHEFELTYDEGRGEVTGSVLVNRFSRHYDGIMLVASPVTDFGDGAIDWGYAAALQDSVGDDGFDPIPQDEPDDDDGSGCDGCDVSAGGSGLPGLLLLLPVAARRRR